jgi:hypothetical protein
METLYFQFLDLTIQLRKALSLNIHSYKNNLFYKKSCQYEK